METSQSPLPAAINSGRGFRNSKRHITASSPPGPWAEWFSIIAWPITHAILPRYLQWQFAKTLYDLRFQLANLETLSPNAVGELLATTLGMPHRGLENFYNSRNLQAGSSLRSLATGR